MFPYIHDCNLKNAEAMVNMIEKTRVINVADHLTKTKPTLPESAITKLRH